MAAMSDSAPGQPDAYEIGPDRLLRLRTADGVKTYYVDGPQDDGGYRLVPLVQWETLPQEVRESVERGEADPERWIRRQPGRAG